MSKNLKYLIFTQPLQERGWGEAKNEWDFPQTLGEAIC